MPIVPGNLGDFSIFGIEAFDMSGGSDSLAFADGGRRRIAVNQSPSGGRDYPFMDPSEDVRDLLGDFYLSFEDPGFAFVPPFRIGWLYGFGTSGGSAPGYAFTPVNDREIVVLDAEDQVVFSSENTISGGYQRQDWAGVRDVIQWITEDAVCRLVAFTKWDPGDDDPIEYDLDLVPENGILDPRTHDRRPGRVNQLLADETTLGPAVVVDFEAGYNTRMTIQESEVVEGQRRVTQVVIDAQAGLGLGRYPGCQDSDVVLRQLNGQRPDARGNLRMDAIGCFQLVQPGTRTLTDDIPSAEVALTEATLTLKNGCQPCCDCDDIIRTYKGVKNIFEQFQAMGSRAEQVRNLHRDNINRWETERLCRENNPARLTVVPFCNNMLGVAGAMCNMQDQCRNDIELRLTFGFVDGQASNGTPTTITLQSADAAASNAYVDHFITIVDGPGAGQQRLITANSAGSKVATVDEAWDTDPTSESIYVISKPADDADPYGEVGCDSTQIKTVQGPERYALGGTWPSFSAFYETVDARQPVSVTFRMEFPGAEVGDQVVTALQIFEGYGASAVQIASLRRWAPLIPQADCECQEETA